MKKMKMIAAGVAASMAFALPQAASAQEWPMEGAGWVDVGMIEVDDGHGLDYANHLAGLWKKAQEFSKSQGWITDYQVWTNPYPREGESDFLLITWFPRFATPEEEKARDDAYRAHMAMTTSQMQAASGERANYRKVKGSMLFRHQEFTK